MGGGTSGVMAVVAGRDDWEGQANDARKEGLAKLIAGVVFATVLVFVFTMPGPPRTVWGKTIIATMFVPLMLSCILEGIVKYINAAHFQVIAELKKK